MEKAQLDNYFGIYIGSEDLEERKPSPEPLWMALKSLNFDYENNDQLREDVWYIGDTKYDIDAAHNAGLFAIGITHESTAELMISSNPDVIVDSVNDLFHSIMQFWD